MIIDVHTHIHSLQEDGLRAEGDIFVEECRRNGVRLILVSSVGAFERYPAAEDVHRYNALVETFDARMGDRTRWLLYINPQHESCRQEIDHWSERGAVGVKLWVSLKDESGSLDRTVEAVRYAGRKGLPVLIHAWDRRGPNLPGEVTLDEFAELAERCPEATLIGAHANGNWRHAIGALRGRLPKAYVDICGSFPEKGMVEALVEDIGADRILYGSDATGRSMASQISKVVLADIAEEQKESILWKNAARVFGLEGLREQDQPEPSLRPESDLPDRQEDHFCFCGRWPFFETACETPAHLEKELERHDVAKAFTGDLGSVYRMDLEAANAAFLSACAGCARVAPLAVVNPCTSNWRHVLDKMDDGFAGVLLHPYLHNWRPDDPGHAALFRACSEQSKPVWMNCRLGDDRCRHSGVEHHLPNADELIAFAANAPPNRYVFQGLGRHETNRFLEATQGDDRFRTEISRLTDGTGVLQDVLERHGRDKLVMGSEYPLRDMKQVWWTALRV